jgi:hypothetical protein
MQLLVTSTLPSRTQVLSLFSPLSLSHTHTHSLLTSTQLTSIFYKLLDELKAECEELMAKGISGSGEGFEGASAGRLGAHSFIPQHNPAPERMRDVALKVGAEEEEGTEGGVEGVEGVQGRGRGKGTPFLVASSVIWCVVQSWGRM